MPDLLSGGRTSAAKADRALYARALLSRRAGKASVVEPKLWGGWLQRTEWLTFSDNCSFLADEVVPTVNGLHQCLPPWLGDPDLTTQLTADKATFLHNAPDKRHDVHGPSLSVTCTAGPHLNASGHVCCHTSGCKKSWRASGGLAMLKAHGLLTSVTISRRSVMCSTRLQQCATHARSGGELVSSHQHICTIWALANIFQA